MKRLGVIVAGVMYAAELYALAEILYAHLGDGEETIYDHVAEWWDGFKDRCRIHRQAEDVLEQIRDLPETGK